MRRVVLVCLAGMSLAGCSSFSVPGMDAFKPAPTTAVLQLETTPPGADAQTSLGQSCKTPCSVTVTPGEATSLSVTYTLNKYQPQTVDIQVVRQEGSFSTPATLVLDPNPATVQLQPSTPPRRSRRPAKRAVHHPAAATGAAPAPAAAPPPAASSPFPSPSSSQ